MVECIYIYQCDSLPEHARDILAGWQEKASDVLVWAPVDWRGDKEIFYYNTSWLAAFFVATRPVALVCVQTTLSRSTYNYQLVVAQQLPLVEGIVAHPPQAERFQERQNVTAEAAL
jgi:hypothetical protein